MNVLDITQKMALCDMNGSDTVAYKYWFGKADKTVVVKTNIPIHHSHLKKHYKKQRLELMNVRKDSPELIYSYVMVFMIDTNDFLISEDIRKSAVCKELFRLHNDDLVSGFEKCKVN